MARGPGSATGAGASRRRDDPGEAGRTAGAGACVTNTETRAQQMQRRQPSRQSSAADSPVLSVQPSGAITVSSSVDCTAKTASHNARKRRISRNDTTRSGDPYSLATMLVCRVAIGLAPSATSMATFHVPPIDS